VACPPVPLASCRSTESVRCAGDDLAGLFAPALRVTGRDGVAAPWVRDGDVLVVTQKVVSKSEGRIVLIDTDDPDAKRRWWSPSRSGCCVAGATS